MTKALLLIQYPTNEGRLGLPILMNKTVIVAGQKPFATPVARESSGPTPRTLTESMKLVNPQNRSSIGPLYPKN